ncbi:hypothetical protein [Phaeobacter inhibens]|uniref:hypothetical protein n=1 Tax=Phaeobacter inhibens TaxID=221822 RepID=UPI0021A2AEC2|nr:hypothetical protein [Phaeobacter inhibens]UWR51561.1 hypothetical protein K4F84_10045 [Phaeobacter inhibens]UWR67126.1 hypothetical protein K4K95_10160 [Phaeobacter inhibens]UWR71060.1 hypothetical protein K4L00_10145 [Phaeobacter inhibens]
MTETSKEAVERFTVTENRDGLGFSNGIKHSSEGEFVSYSDYLALRKAVDSYSYIGRDGKAVLAKDLEDERDALRAQLQAAQNETAKTLWQEYLRVDDWLLTSRYERHSARCAIRCVAATCAQTMCRSGHAWSTSGSA